MQEAKVSKALAAAVDELPENRRKHQLQVRLPPAPPLSSLASPQPGLSCSSPRHRSGATPAQADAARYAGLLYAKLEEAAQRADPAISEHPSKRRRVAAHQQPARRGDTNAAGAEGVETGLLLDRDYDARLQEVRLHL